MQLFTNPQNQYLRDPQYDHDLQNELLWLERAIIDRIDVRISLAIMGGCDCFLVSQNVGRS